MKKWSPRSKGREMSGEAWPYVADIEYVVGSQTSRHVICARSAWALQSAFQKVNVGVQETEEYKKHEGMIDKALVRGPFGPVVDVVESVCPALTTGWYEGISGQDVRKAIRMLGME